MCASLSPILVLCFFPSCTHRIHILDIQVRQIIIKFLLSSFELFGLSKKNFYVFFCLLSSSSCRRFLSPNDESFGSDDEAQSDDIMVLLIKPHKQECFDTTSRTLQNDDVRVCVLYGALRDCRLLMLCRFLLNFFLFLSNTLSQASRKEGKEKILFALFARRTHVIK